MILFIFLKEWWWWFYTVSIPKSPFPNAFRIGLVGAMFVPYLEVGREEVAICSEGQWGPQVLPQLPTVLLICWLTGRHDAPAPARWPCSAGFCRSPTLQEVEVMRHQHRSQFVFTLSYFTPSFYILTMWPANLQWPQVHPIDFFTSSHTGERSNAY